MIYFAYGSNMNHAQMQKRYQVPLFDLARVLVDKVRKSTSIDWTIRENVQARLRVPVKRTLNQYGYPPDKQALATETVLKQAELFADEWDKEIAKAGW